MSIAHNPPENGAHPGPISWGFETASPRRILCVSGQVGTGPSGKTPEDFLDQARNTWANVGAVLRSAGMTPDNIVRTGIFISSRIQLTPELKREFDVLRVAFLGDNRPSSTMIYVPGLMDPAWLVEIDAIAVEA